MWMTIFNIFRPFVQSAASKRVAEYAADYLNQRRERRLLPPHAVEPEFPAGSEETAPVSAEPVVVYAPVPVGFSGRDVFWFTLSGFFFGGAIGIILAYVARRQEERL